MIVYVIHEEDLHDGSKGVIGLADSVRMVNTLIDEYYGLHDIVSFNDIRDSSIEFVKIIQITLEHAVTYQVKITVQTFELNKV